MKKWTLGFILCVASVTLIACGGVDDDNYGRFDYNSTGSSTYIYTDSKTGCKYLNVGGEGVTPLLNSSGQPDCSSSNNDF